MYYIENEPRDARDARELILRGFGDIDFQEEGHVYTLHGQVIETTISGLGHRFEARPFDTEMQAERYAQRHGKTAEYWKSEWEAKALRATTLGTKTHEYGESLSYILNGLPKEMILDSALLQYDSENNDITPSHPKEEAVALFLKKLPASYHLVLNEARVYSGKNPDQSKNIKELICGTFDMLYWYDGNGNPEKAGYVLFDYKTNSALQSDYNRKHGNFLLPPFNDIYEENLGMYTIQLSAYAMLLEDIGIKLMNRILVWLTDDGRCELIPVKDVSDRLRKIL